jgi:hypothetical protein
MSDLGAGTVRATSGATLRAGTMFVWLAVAFRRSNLSPGRATGRSSRRRL